MSISVARLARTELGRATALLARACTFDPAARVADEKLFGDSPPGLHSVTIGAWMGEELVGVAAGAGRWLRLIAVDPPARGRGIGSALLDTVARELHAAGATKLRMGDQPGNYLAPGIDERNAPVLAWLEKRGFVWWGANANLRVPLVDNPLLSGERSAGLAAAAQANGYVVRRADRADAPALAALAASFTPAWAFEAVRALHWQPAAGVHVAELADTGALVAFAVHDGNNAGLGWFGPAGTLPAHRGRGLGAAVLLPCLLDIAAAAHEHATIAWVGPREFYERTVGAVEDRMFVVMEKPLP